jgi:hypothetical protein
MKIPVTRSSVLLAALLATSIHADEPVRAPSREELVPTTAEREARLGWWREARFGMFVHWGVYSDLSGPCIETPLSAAASVNDMLLSSWGDRIRVFPGVPDAWKDVSFHNLRTEGAFLVSAVRKGGVTQWVRIQSLAGEPCRIRPGLKGEVRATVPMKPAGDGAYDLTLAKGQEAVLYTGATIPVCEVAPVAADAARSNFYGMPKAK